MLLSMGSCCGRTSGHASVPRDDVAEPRQERAGVHTPQKQPEQATRHPAAVRAGTKRRDHKKVELRNLGKTKAKRARREALPIRLLRAHVTSGA